MLKGFREYFTYSRAERNGFLILLGTIILLVAVVFIRPYFQNSEFEELSSEKFSFASVSEEFDKRDSIQKSTYQKNTFKNKSSIKLFDFDPNHTSKKDFVKLGFSAKQAAVIIKYRKKAIFRNPEDFKKVFVVNDWMFNRLAKHIVITDTEEYIEEDVEDDHNVEGTNAASRFDKTVYSTSNYDINVANAEELDSIKGIGEKLAQRIIKFRTNLGGVLRIEQLRDVYGLSEENYDLISNQLFVKNPEIKKFEINSIEFKTLLKHPYFDYDMTKSIFNLRDKLKRFENMEDLKILSSIDDEFANKIEPYISFK